MSRIWRLNAACTARIAAVTLTDLSSAHTAVFVEGDALPSGVDKAIVSALRSGMATNIDLDCRIFFINATFLHQESSPSVRSISAKR